MKSEEEILIEAIRNFLRKYNLDDETIENTPKRIVKVWKEFLNNNNVADVKTFNIETDYERKGEFNQMVIWQGEFVSLCKHHFLPYFGKIYIGYLPTTKVIGLSKITKIVKNLTRKPTIQEELTQELNKEIRKNIEGVIGVAVVIKALHTCNLRYDKAYMITSSLSGIFKHNPFAKEEFFKLIETSKD